MGRPRVKIIDDAQEEALEKAPKKRAEKATIDDRKIEDRTLKIENGESKEEVPSSILNLQESIVHSPSSTVKKTAKPGKTKPRSKKYQELTKDLDRTKIYSLAEAVDMAKKMSYSKINATLEAHINTTQTGIRGLVSLPYAKGVQLRILIFGPSNPQIEGSFLVPNPLLKKLTRVRLPLTW